MGEWAWNFRSPSLLRTRSSTTRAAMPRSRARLSDLATHVESYRKLENLLRIALTCWPALRYSAFPCVFPGACVLTCRHEISRGAYKHVGARVMDFCWKFAYIIANHSNKASQSASAHLGYLRSRLDRVFSWCCLLVVQQLDGADIVPWTLLFERAHGSHGFTNWGLSKESQIRRRRWQRQSRFGVSRI